MDKRHKVMDISKNGDLEQPATLHEPALPYSLEELGEYTVADYYALPEDRRVELIDGRFYDMASPSRKHQAILLQLSIQFSACAEACGKQCEVYIAPCDVQLDRDERTMLQPDLFVICRDYDRNAHALIGPPDLIVEILSPSTRSRDMLLKLNKYYSAQVREYWIVDPENEKILVYDFSDPSLYPETYTFDSKIPVHISEGKCQIDFSDIKSRIK